MDSVRLLPNEVACTATIHIVFSLVVKREVTAGNSVGGNTMWYNSDIQAMQEYSRQPAKARCVNAFVSFES